ncbi:MAG: patatin-like phospholipase family protein [Rhodocyclaceae bacterium]|nr:patatin-like phospholipase family protein [Rhodocyclaceae bacterium]
MTQPRKRRIAIACQGGGSQTAFTAGVLQGLFANGIDQTHDIVALTGTSGGAVNTALAWYGMLKQAAGDKTPVQKRIAAFWDELKASSPLEQWLDQINTFMIRAAGAGHLPKLESSPSSQLSQLLQQSASYLLPREHYLDFKGLLESHINFDELPQLIEAHSPALFMGASNVLNGKIRIFNSLADPITVETILASAAIPSVFPAVKIGNDYYWDGLFSSNPPISPVLRPVHMTNNMFPDEIWVVLIDPLRYDKTPTTPGEILERRTQMTSNISLVHDLEKIAIFDRAIKGGGFKEGYLEERGLGKLGKLTFRLIRISDALQPALDYSSKLSRNPQLIDRLMAEGIRQVEDFMPTLSKPGADPESVLELITE